jgi:predicted PurR-regulated permease PerM
MDNKQIQVSITSSTIISAVLIGAGAYTLWLLRDLVLLVLTAIVIASAIEPGVVFFVKKKVPRVLAVLGMYFMVFGSLFASIYFFVPP